MSTRCDATTSPTAVSPGIAPSPRLDDAVQTLKIRASVERAMSRARGRDAETHTERAVRAQKLEDRARDLAREEKWGAAARIQLRAAGTEPQSTRRWLQAARWQRQDGDPFGAVETVKRGLRDAHEPESVIELRAMLCEALMECSEWNDCARECRALLQVDPRHHAGLEALATALLHQGRVAEAADTFRALLRISPCDPLHRLKLAALLHVQGHLGAAVREFERVEALSPSAEWAQEAQEAIESLDRLQIEGVMLCASRPDARGDEFRQLARRDLDAALARHDFHLSEAGRETLRHLLCEGRPTPESVPLLPRVH